MMKMKCVTIMVQKIVKKQDQKKLEWRGIKNKLKKENVKSLKFLKIKIFSLLIKYIMHKIFVKNYFQY